MGVNWDEWALKKDGEVEKSNHKKCVSAVFTKDGENIRMI